MKKPSDGQCAGKWDKDRLIKALKSGAEKRKQGKMLNVEEATAFMAVAIHIGTILQLYELYGRNESSDSDGKRFENAQVYGCGRSSNLHSLCE